MTRKFDHVAAATEERPRATRTERSRAVLLDAALTTGVLVVAGGVLGALWGWRFIDAVAVAVIVGALMWCIGIPLRSETVRDAWRWIITLLLYRQVPIDNSLDERLILVNVPQARRLAEQRAAAERVSQFRAFVEGIPIRGLTMEAWKKRLKRERYQEFRDSLIRLGWARWKSETNERSGWELVLSAEEILELIADW